MLDYACSTYCQLHPEDKVVGDLDHHLALCPVLDDRREVLFVYWDFLVSSNTPCKNIIASVRASSTEVFMQFILDCSVHPEVISAVQEHGDVIHELLFKATRTFCYSMYREHLKRLERWS